jgi:chemotaxis signal transduction protein
MIRTPRSTRRVGGGLPPALASAPPVAELHLVTLVGTERFAFPVAHVEEVIDAPRLSWVPGAPDGLLGQMRHRDRTVSAYDAGAAFGVRRANGTGTALILRDDAARVAVVVDDAEDLQLVAPESVRAVPTGADADGVLRGVCIAAGRGLMSLVRVDALVARVTARDPRVDDGSAR